MDAQAGLGFRRRPCQAGRGRSRREGDVDADRPSGGVHRIGGMTGEEAGITGWLVEFALESDDEAGLLKLALPGRRDYHTVAGFALARLGRFPRLGDAFEFGSWRFEVIDIDGRRIDKVLAQPLRKPAIAP